MLISAVITILEDFGSLLPARTVTVNSKAIIRFLLSIIDLNFCDFKQSESTLMTCPDRRVTVNDDLIVIYSLNIEILTGYDYYFRKLI